jgi:protein-tyrosine phosphatase
MKKTREITDIHCHILPGIDDGAKDLDVTTALLREEKRQGVTRIAFTPHFYADRMNVKEWFQNRYNAAKKTQPVLEELGIEWSAGAEVRLVPELLDMDLSRFQYIDSGYLLLEWPFNQYPVWGNEVVDGLFDKGITPVFAHIERYPYFWNHIEELDSYIEQGCLCQINPGTLIHESSRKYTIQLIKRGYIHVLSSDAHNMDRRPPRLQEAYEIIDDELGKDKGDWLAENARKIVYGEEIDIELKKKRRFHLFG